MIPIAYGSSASAAPGIPWTPSQLTTALWLDNFSSGTPQTLYDATTGGSLPSDGSEVRSWKDQSGNNRHAQGLFSGQSPVRRSSLVNSRDAIDFDGADDFLLPSIISTSYSNITVAVIFRVDASPTFPAGAAFAHRSTGTRLIYMGYEDNQIIWALRGSGNAYQALYYGVTLNQWNISIGTLDVANNDHKLRVNGALRATNTYNFGSEIFDSDLNYIGCQVFGFGRATFFSGEIAAMIVMASTITDSDAQKIEGYWAHAFGQTSLLASGHPYISSPPTI